MAALVATVGPASAACMIPRDNFWPLGDGVLAINASVEDLFPNNVSASQYGRYQECDQPNYNFVPGLRGTCPWSRDIRGLNSLLVLGTNIQSFSYDLDSNSIWHGNWSIFRAAPLGDDVLLDNQASSSVSTNITTSGISGYPIHISTSVQAIGLWPFSVSTYQPWVNIDNVFDAGSRVKILASPVWWNLTQTQPSTFGPGQPNITMITPEDLSGIRVDLKNISSSLSAYNIFIFSSTAGQDGKYGMVLVSGNAAFGSDFELEGLWLTPLSIELGWIPSTWQQRANAVHSTSSLDLSQETGFRRVVIAQDWIDTINPWLSIGNTTLCNYVSSDLTCETSHDECGAVSTYPRDPALVISALLTATLSKMTPEPGQCDDLGEWSLLDAVGGCRTVAGEDIERSTSHWVMKFYRPGYGYGSDNVAVCISLAILVLYSCIAIAHIVYSAWTGLSSSLWDSLSESWLCVSTLGRRRNYRTLAPGSSRPEYSNLESGS